MLGGARDFNISVRLAGQELVSTQFFMPPAPNETYSACLAAKIDQMLSNPGDALSHPAHVADHRPP